MMKLILENWRRYLEDSSKVMEIEIDGATIEGVIHDDLQRLLNWANKEGVSEEILQSLDLPAAILKSIFVPEETRGQGVGVQLMDEFMNEAAEAHEAHSIILIADLGQSQAEGFGLVEWYKGYGFEVVGEDSGGNPVMVLEQ